jgi:hypothetical protein
MENRNLAVHRTIVAVDVEGFGDRHRTNSNQVAIRNGLYGAMREAFLQAGIPWNDRDHEDRGDGMFILVGSEVPKSLFVESLPSALASALRRHNGTHSGPEQIRLRMALHAGEVNYDQHGATAVSINLTFRLLEAAPVKGALADSSGVLAVIASSWFFEEVIRHNAILAAAYAPVPVVVKETTTTGWICLPDRVDWPARLTLNRLTAITATAGGPMAAQHATRIRQALSRAYVSALKGPITSAGDMPVGLEIPTLGEGYIDHRIRVSEVTSSSEPGRESWWTDVPVNDSACNFLLTILTSPKALTAPLVLLGQPGSGKSVLTRILAARFSTEGFLPVLVELRQAAAEADLQNQLEFAIRNASGEIVQWPEIVESGDRVLPVVIFDGFDELLQATGVAQNDFLLRIQEFQEREARLGRPLAVIVTSRTAVTDRARFPHGAAAIRLEPFDEGQIAAWLKIWDQTNRVSLARRGMRPLPASVALIYGELAEQPLLLLMLALYDADANVLQHRSAVLSQTELYSRLLKDFASREIRKHSPALPEDDLERAVETELFRLSVVAFAMFNRRSQWVPEADLDADFSVLLIDGGPHQTGSDRSRTELTVAQLTVGRFFFVHEARATHGNRQLRTYEFLHATFGEFLVARLVVHVLTGMLESRPASIPSPQQGTDSGMLHALLSFAALTARSPVVAFLGDLFDQLDTWQRAAIAEVLLQLHNLALFRQEESAYSYYEPLALPVTTRHAAWSANLVVLAVLAAGEITGSQLFPLEPDAQLAWRAEALIWRSQLAGDGWGGLHRTIAFHRVWDGRRKEFRLTRNDGTFMPEDLDMSWTFNHPPGPGARKGIFSSPAHNSLMAQRKLNFAANMSEDIIAHGLAPLVSYFPATANVFVVLDDERVVSAVHALISALSEPYRGDPLRESIYLDLAQVTRKLLGASNVAQDAPYLKMALGVLISAVDQGIVSPASVEPIAELISNMTTEDMKLTELLARLDRLLSDYGLTGTATLKDEGWAEPC